MNALIAFFTRNPVASNLLMLYILIAGYLSIDAIPKEYLPPRVDATVWIEMAYPGASPRETEQALCIPIEDAVREVEGIAHINTTANEGQCRIQINLEEGFDANLMREQIAARVETIAVFPQEAEKARVHTYKRAYDPLATVCVHGKVDPLLLAGYARDLRDELARLPEVREVRLSGLQPYEVSVEIPARQLARYDLSLTEVAATLEQRVLDLPAGSLRSPQGS